MDLEAVRTFVDVMREGSFTAVARARDLDPSSVSRAIGRLEEELGFALFQRSTRRLTPTEAGRAYHGRVQALLEGFDRAGEQALDLVSQPTGTLRVTTCTSFGERLLVPLLPEFRRLHPALTLDLMLTDEQVDLTRENVDVAVRFGEAPDAGGRAIRLFSRRFRVCASPAWLKDHPHPPAPDDLADHDCLLFPLPGYRSRWWFRRGRDAPFPVQVGGHLMVSHGASMTRCAVLGLGPSLVPDWLCRDELADGRLVDLFPDYECTPTAFDTAAWLIHGNYVPLKLRVFVDFLRTRLGAP